MRLSRHLERLRLPSSEAYLDWCTRYGFTPSLRKGVHELKQEYAAFSAKCSEAALARRKLHAGALGACLAVLEGTLHPSEIGAQETRRACSPLAGLSLRTNEREALVRLLTVTGKRARCLTLTERAGVARTEVPWTAAFVHLVRVPWRRPLEDWRPRSKNRRKQVASLLRHLVAEHPVPGFLDEAWLRSDDIAPDLRRWFLHIGAGQNPRTGPSPIPLTKREAHHLLTAPDGFPVEAAVRWAQVHALGGGPELAHALAATRLGRSFEHESFWINVLRLFAASPMLDPSQVGPLIDYIAHQKFSGVEIVEPDGNVRYEPAPQPGMSMRGRTAASLVQQMERWHRELGRGNEHGHNLWDPCGVAGLRLESGQRNPVVWTLKELRSAKALALEGRAMGHCVSTYARSCAAGRCSIWSLERQNSDGSQRRVTIELSRQNVIIQARGRRNAQPERQDMEILRRWATEQNLHLGTYL